ncbi:MAG: tRNA (N(6)-L-threonylcarbamoyladenosine(37)-C(2))-methylthiotransferase MtaB [bacterium]
MKISFFTYGCKVNQYETELIKQMFLKTGGFTEVTDDSVADVSLINTCTVTAKIDSEIARKIRQLKAKQKCKVILTGCLVQRQDSADLTNLADWIIPNEKKFMLASYPPEIINTPAAVYESILEGFSGKNKAFVKVEDGCDRFCAYCTVPLVRGSKIRSRDEAEILKEIKQLSLAGFKEIILTGVNLGLFGKEKNSFTALYDILKAIIQLPGSTRVRLSSIGPVDLSNEVINLASENPERICPHFHLSMQSGDDAVLKRMNRNYDTGLYRKKVEYIISKMPYAGINTDVIAGFPGETKEEFENTVAFIKEIPFSRLHVFPYSDRPNTKATVMDKKLDDKMKKERVKILMKIAEEKEIAFAQKNKDRILSALIEEGGNADSLFGYTENYIRVKVENDEKARKCINNIVPVKIVLIENGDIHAKIV